MRDDPRIVGYEVHFGTSSGRYQWRRDATSNGASTNRLTLDAPDTGTTYYFVVRSRNADRSLVSAFSTEVSISGGGQTVESIVESGEAMVGDAWQWVSFNQRFSDPIVVSTTSSEDGRDPSVIRIDGVEPSGFWIRLQAWDYLPRPAQPERVGYIVVERGRHRLPGGAQVEAGRIVTDVTGTQRMTSFTSDFTTPPVVAASVSSYRDHMAVTTRTADVSRSGFKIGMTEQESSTRKHGAETIDYVAWEPSSGEVGGARYVVNRTGNVLTDRPYRITYRGHFSEPPVLIADMQTFNGPDPSTLRWRYKTSSEVELRVVEEQSLDAETRHTLEVGGYIMIER
ncbi:hypothetical protein BDD21_4965 [Thiocapsa rosea]|uniref:Fibronectin type-III domain-containing protein n=1 Tax=Thiocapsa rosea TaxID=69360 RepID=A0A495VG37_9GAMM|nr:hypothetical protein BDD21_4965 [Thiocapsa rosea]